MDIKVCAVVVTYNRQDLLKECLNAILSQTYPVTKVLLVDNASTDGTHEMIDALYLSDSRMEYHALPKNIGGAGGFSAGMAMALKSAYDWIWIMDDDTIPDQTCLEKLLNVSTKTDKISFLASSVYGIDGLPMNVPGAALTALEKNGYGSFLRFLDSKMVQIESATFVSILVRYHAVKQVGIPCAFFFIWGDDVEYTLRLTNHYGPAYVVGDSKALHKRMGNANLSVYTETNERRIAFYRYSVRNSLIVAKEYFGKRKLFFEECRKIKMLFCLAVMRTEKKGAKIKAVLGGLFDYYFKRYDFKAFRNRMK